MLFDRCYLLYEGYRQEKKVSVYILKLCQEIGQSFEKVFEDGYQIQYNR